MAVTEQETIERFMHYVASYYPYLLPVVRDDSASIQKALSEGNGTVSNCWAALIAAGRMQGFIAFTPYTSLAGYFGDVQSAIIQKLYKYEMRSPLQ